MVGLLEGGRLDVLQQDHLETSESGFDYRPQFQRIYPYSESRRGCTTEFSLRRFRRSKRSPHGCIVQSGQTQPRTIGAFTYFGSKVVPEPVDGSSSSGLERPEFSVVTIGDDCPGHLGQKLGATSEIVMNEALGAASFPCCGRDRPIVHALFSQDLDRCARDFFNHWMLSRCGMAGRPVRKSILATTRLAVHLVLILVHARVMLFGAVGTLPTGLLELPCLFRDRLGLETSVLKHGGGQQLSVAFPDRRRGTAHPDGSNCLGG